MIKGMTGFGLSRLTTNKIKAVVEIKSLNHRYFDISYYLPTGFGSAELRVRRLVQKYIERGRINVSVKLLHKPSPAITLNNDAVKSHIKYANQLKREYGLKNDLNLSDIIRLPGVFDIKEDTLNLDELMPGLEKCIKSALASLIKMRKGEGLSLQKDISEKLRRMLVQLKKIQTRSRVYVSALKKKLTPEEFQSSQKSCDINEEIVRLLHYIGEMKKLLKSNGAVGKRIDFIAQEMQRETNTIGSKLQDKVVTNAVIALKSKIEKIREQAQNIE